MYEKKYSESIYYLINDLCNKLLVSSEHIKAHHKTKTMQKFKSTSFEILLKKSKEVSLNIEKDFDSIKELNCQIFAARLKANLFPKELARFAEFDKYLGFVTNEPYFLEGYGKDMLLFILLLHSSVNHIDETETQTLRSLLVPGPFTLHAEYKNNHHYPENMLNIICSPPQFFKGLQTLKHEDYSCISRFTFNGESPNFHDTRNRTVLSPQESMENTFMGFDTRLWGTTSHLNVQAFRFFPNNVKVPETKIAKFSESRRNSLASVNPNTEVNLISNKTIFSCNWENLGYFGILMVNPFITESNKFALDLQCIYTQSIGISFTAKLVSHQSFLNDVKLLTVGIQSDSFKHCENIIFEMTSNLTVNDILPSSMQSYITDFLECGTCYKRLQIMILKKNYKLNFEGFMFKALCSAVDEYLVTFRQLVFSFQDDRLIQFYKRVKRMMKQLASLSYTLAVHPNVDIAVKPPLGSQFLGYLYKEIMRLTERDHIMLLVFILRRCCHVYFKHLHKWIFYGILDDASNELFVCFDGHYRKNTKYFYDKAYFVRKESVPGFFQNFEDQILLCGKYTMLLKAFRPSHPLFGVEFPSMSVCLSFDEVQKMEESCRKYYEFSREVCGKPITIRGVFDKQVESKKKFFKIVSERSRINMERWNDEQQVLAARNAKLKKKHHEELVQLLQDVENRKIAERRANVATQLKNLKEIKELADNRLCQDNFNLSKRIEYYQELCDFMTQDVNKASKEIALSNISLAPTGVNVYIDDELGVFVKNKESETPGSTAGTDFESCLGDEDSDSIYGECTSEEFELKFQETANEVGQICLSNDNNNSDIEDVEGNILLGSIKRSSSDFFNSNELPPVIMTAMQKNRKKVLGGTNFANCIKEVVSSPLLVETTNVQFTKAHKKKLTNEFGNYPKILSADINSNPIVKVELSDLQKNRIKMMQNDTFAQLNKDLFPNRQHLNLDLNSEFSRNRKKVLNSEFYISTNTLSSDDVQLTPMSTKSDTVAINTSSSLTLNVGAEQNIDELANALHEVPTSKQEFNFNRTQDVVQCVEVSSKTEIICLVTDYEQPYKRCVELVENNFKCETKNPFFRLNVSKNNKASMNRKRDNLKSLSVVSLTEFLQKSIVIPMNTHLEIINNEVMRLFLKDLRILGHFKSLRNYFFLMDGEFGSIICDGIIAKLESGASPEKLMNYQMLHSILDTALSSSIMGSDKNAENLSFIVSDLPESFDLNSPSVLSHLSLSYRIDWPLSLVLNPETLDQYANIFKYLIKVRRISWVLEESYQVLKEIVKMHGKTLLKSPQYRHVQQIRHKFYHFVHALKNHITSNALQASWKTFKDDLLNANTIEDVYRKHTNYVKRILFLCMLNRRSGEFNKTIENIFKISLRFYRNLKSSEFKKDPVNKYYTHSRYEKLASDEIDFDKFIKYTIYLGNKIVRHGYQEEIGEFISLINYNQYYIADSV